MKRVLGSFFTLILLYLLQTTLINKMAIAGVKANVILLIVVTIGYRYGKIPGILMGFFTGLLVDMVEGVYLGYYALMYLLVGYFVGFSNKVYHKEHNVIPLLLIAGSDVALNLMQFISGFLVRNRLNLPYYAYRIILPEMIYTVVISAVFYKLISLLFHLLERKKVELKEEDRKGGNAVD